MSNEREAFEKWWDKFCDDGYPDSDKFIADSAWQACADRKQQEIEALAAQVERMRKNLSMMFDAWESGESCWEDAEEFTGYLGKAVNLSTKEEDEIIAVLSLPASDCLKERDARVLKEARSNIETMNAQMRIDIQDVCDALDQMAVAKERGE